MVKKKCKSSTIKKQLQVKPLGHKKWINVRGNPTFEELDRRFTEYNYRLVLKRKCKK